MQEQLVYLIGNAFRIYIYFKLLNTMFGTAKVKQIWIIIGFTFYFLINSFGAILFGNFTLNILTNIDVGISTLKFHTCILFFES